MSTDWLDPQQVREWARDQADVPDGHSACVNWGFALEQFVRAMDAQRLGEHNCSWMTGKWLDREQIAHIIVEALDE